MKCLCCGKEVIYPRLKYCSAECMKDYSKVLQKQFSEKMHAKYFKCAICGDGLTGRKRKYCSKECYREWCRRQARKKAIEEWRKRSESENRTEPADA